MKILGKVKNQFGDFDRVAINGFPYEIWRNKDGQLCRYFNFLGVLFVIIEGEGTYVSSKERSGYVLSGGYNFKTGEIETHMGTLKLRNPNILKQVKLFEEFIFYRKYNQSLDIES